MAPPREEARGPEINLSGVIERIVWLDEDTHFTIAELSQENGEKVIILGNLTGVQCGETIDCVGYWERHPMHGPQCRVKSFTSRLPSSVHGIRKYLGSGLIKGIGKTYAEKIVAQFGTRTFEIISHQSARLREVEGIGPGRAKSIKAAWEEQKSLREVMVFLQTYGVTNALCLRIVKAYGENAKKVLTTEPYRVCREVEGIGFKTADKIARNLGLPTAGSQRVDAGIIHTLEELEGEGHSAFPEEGLLEKATNLLGVDRAVVHGRLKELIKENALGTLDTNEVRLIQLRPQENAERSIASSIKRLLSTPHSLPPIHAEKAVTWAQERAGFVFSEAQSQAILMGLSHKVSVLTGGPGTGKTTILKALCDILNAKKVKMVLGAPTGRAAKRLHEATRIPAATIHRLLKFDPSAGGFTANAENPLTTDFVIIDESSMLDTKLAAALLRAIPSSAHILLVGDVNQLPSVGAGNVLHDLIRSEKTAVTRLDTVFRQGARSGIVMIAHEILHGNAHPPAPEDNLTQLDYHRDIHFIRADEPEACVQCVTQLCSEILPRALRLDPLRDIQVLAPMHKGTGGIQAFNQALQDKLRGTQTRSSRITVGDKVIQTRNNYDKGIFNGDFGVVLESNPETGDWLIDFDGTKVEFERSEQADLQLAYAVSIHKSQGSEFPAVVVPLLRQHSIMLARNLIYTAITRGRKQVILVGDPSAYAMAVKNIQDSGRVTGLLPRLQKID
ncbi:MAG: ATP-dependent RecD-like DNA helicase [Verrucomicrobia bacterium]|nr:ATP-dependent RecD-like DNA helicase [Verrucomicrobiota bacterium]